MNSEGASRSAFWFANGCPFLVPAPVESRERGSKLSHVSYDKGRNPIHDGSQLSWLNHLQRLHFQILSHWGLDIDI